MSDRHPCAHCGRPAHATLCDDCTNELHENLVGLRRWIGYLRDAANGQTRLGESARRSTDLGSPALAALGPRGDFTGSPSELLTYVHSVLTEWAIDLHNSHQMPIPGAEHFTDARTTLAAVSHTQGGGDIALWLAQGTQRLKHDENAHILHREITQIITDISNTINRPRPPRNLGPCPTITDNHNGTNTHGKRCATRLTAPHSATETQCPTCKTTHNVNTLIATLIGDVQDWDFTQQEALFAMEALGQPIPLRTFRHWRTTNKLPTRYDTDGTPVYRITEIRELADAKRQTRPTGATTHERNRT